MLKWIAAILAVLLIAYVGVAYLYSVSLRHAGIIEGRNFLKMAAKDYAEHGYVTNYGSSSYEIWLSTNVVTIGGTQHQCFFTVRVHKFHDAGTLAMTTNKTFVWLDSKRPPKIIDASYRPPIFPPRF